MIIVKFVNIKRLKLKTTITQKKPFNRLQILKNYSVFRYN